MKWILLVAIYQAHPGEPSHPGQPNMSIRPGIEVQGYAASPGKPPMPPTVSTLEFRFASKELAEKASKQIVSLFPAGSTRFAIFATEVKE